MHRVVSFTITLAFQLPCNRAAVAGTLELAALMKRGLAGFSLTQLALLLLLSGSALALVSDNKNQAPLGGAPGALLMWWICSRRKEKPIGGWLLYFYIQLYVGGAVGIIFMLLSLKNYNPATWQSMPLYWLFLISGLPGQLLLVAQVVVASVLLKKRQWRWVEYMQLLFALDLAFGLLAVLIDHWHFQDNVAFNFLTLAYASIWLLYFWKSVRVRSVFKTKDWKAVPAPPSTVPA